MSVRHSPTWGRSDDPFEGGGRPSKGTCGADAARQPRGMTSTDPLGSDATAPTPARGDASADAATPHLTTSERDPDVASTESVRRDADERWRAGPAEEALRAGSRATGSGLRRALCVGAVIACLPYLALKVHWLFGGRTGLLDPQFGHSAFMVAANAVTFAMEVVAVVLAVAFVAPWGRRLPAPVVLLPMWVGTGLLGGILVTVPFQLLMMLLVAAPPSSPASPGATADVPPIADWVYAVVYAGFGVLGLCLIGGFALYAGQRWLRPGGWARPLREWARSAPVPVAGCGVVAVAFGVVVAAIGFAGDPRGIGRALGDAPWRSRADSPCWPSRRAVRRG